MIGKERECGGERGKIGNERCSNRGDASAHLCDHSLCSVEVNLIVPFPVHVLVSVFVFASIKRAFACVLQGLFLVAFQFHLCVRVQSLCFIDSFG